MADTSTVFVSWSGSEAHKIAEQLVRFIKSVLPTSRLFLSSEDIEAGKRWFGAVSSALDNCSAGIAVVTPKNITSPWLYFEAGAISKRVTDSLMIPLLCGVSIGDLKDTPLTQFQSKQLDREGILEIVRMVRDVHDFDVSDDALNILFEVWWLANGQELIDASMYEGAAVDQSQTKSVTLEDIAAVQQQMNASIRSIELSVSSTFLHRVVGGMGIPMRYGLLGVGASGETPLALRVAADQAAGAFNESVSSAPTSPHLGASGRGSAAEEPS